MADIPLPADQHHFDTACDDRPYCVIPSHHDVDALTEVAATVADEQKVDVREGVVVRPGDTLILRLDQDAASSPEELEAFRQAIERRLGEDVRVFIGVFDGELAVARAHADDPRVWPQDRATDVTWHGTPVGER